MIPNDSGDGSSGLPLFFPKNSTADGPLPVKAPQLLEDLAHTGAQLCKRSRDLQRAAPVNLETGVGGD